jgi:hypothetical protein
MHLQVETAVIAKNAAGVLDPKNTPDVWLRITNRGPSDVAAGGHRLYQKATDNFDYAIERSSHRELKF